MILYLASNTRPYVSFTVHQCVWFTHNTKAKYETSVKSICQYIQSTKDKGLMFNSSKKMAVDFYANTDVQDCGDMRILKTLFVLGLGLYLW